jgi:hypothetical protein
MPEGVGYNSNVVAGTGLGIAYVGDYAYAYSGVVSIDNTETTMCQFQTPKGLIVASTMFNYLGELGQELFAFRIYFNGIQVQGTIQGRRDYDSLFEGDIKLIIPPLTEVKLTGQNLTDTDSRDMIVSLTGRVYK